MRVMFFPLFYLFISCQTFKLEEGDLLFQDIDCGPMCEAIEAVTYGVDDYNFSHIGLVVSRNDTLYVLEAISAGVVLTPVDSFLSRSLDSNNSPKVIVGRLKEKYRHLNKAAIGFAFEQLGTAYDDAFIMDNGKYYCSELLYDAYKHANGNQAFFRLSPMTFKPVGSTEFFPVWKEYYYALGMDIPEGEAGLNPAGISRSEFVQIVYSYGMPSAKK